MEWKKDSISASELERKQQEYIREAMEMLKRAKPFAENKPDKEEEKAIKADISLPTEENDKSAEEISESTDETAEIIDDISEMAEEAAESIDDISEAAEEIGETAEEISESIDDISEAAEEIGETAEEISESIDDISEAAEEIGETAEEISESIDDISEMAEEAAEISEEIPETIAEDSEEEDTAPKEETEETGGNYGVYSAKELINGAGEDEGLKSAAEMLAELKSKTEIMRSLAEAADPRPEKQDLPKGQFICPKCGRSSQHGRYQ